MRNIYHTLVPLFVRRMVHPIARPKLGLLRLHALYHSRGTVVSGPFAGMKFANRHFDLPKVLGTYEIELHEVFDRLKDRNFQKVVDIGAAEGYYAVGTMLWDTKCSVVAYEANSTYHESIRHLAKANHVEGRLDLRGVCDEESLNRLGSELSDAFVIVDVEGYEKVLLNPESIPALRTATILVEVHDCFVEGCTETIINRFRGSHTISSFKSRDRSVNEYPISSSFANRSFMHATVVKAIGDGRAEPNGWLLLEPKS